MQEPIFAMPKSIALDSTLSARSRLLYGHILSLSYKHGYCWASNETLGRTFGVGIRSIRMDLAELSDAGLLLVDLDNTQRNMTRRKLYPQPGRILPGQPGRIMSLSPAESCPQGIQVRYTSKSKAPPTKLTKTQAVGMAKKLASDSGSARSQAPPELTAAIGKVCMGWKRAGAMPVREWQFIGGDLYAAYLEAFKT